MIKQLLHVKKLFKKFLNSIKLFLLFSTKIFSNEYRDVHYRVPRCPVPSTEMSHMFSTEMSRSRDVLIPTCICGVCICNNVSDFNNRNLVIIELLYQGYHFHKLLKTFTKFYYRYKDLV